MADDIQATNAAEDKWFIECVEPNGEQYLLRYTEAETEAQAWSHLDWHLAHRMALVHPLAQRRAVRACQRMHAARCENGES